MRIMFSKEDKEEILNRLLEDVFKDMRLVKKSQDDLERRVRNLEREQNIERSALDVAEKG